MSSGHFRQRSWADDSRLFGCVLCGIRVSGGEHVEHGVCVSRRLLLWRRLEDGLSSWYVCVSLELLFCVTLHLERVVDCVVTVTLVLSASCGVQVATVLHWACHLRRTVRCARLTLPAR